MSAAFDFGRTLSISAKEMRHIRRDPVTLAASLGLPTLMVLFFGFAIDFDVRGVGLLVADGDLSRPSRQLVEVLSGSSYFRVDRVASAGAAAAALGAERGKAAVVIDRGFGADVRAGRPASAQVLLDGADNSYAGTVASYLAEAEQTVRRRLTDAPPPSMELRTRYLFNPELDSHWFVVPGIFVVVVGLIATLLTALTVAKEWETGSMELLLSTPVRPLEIIVGKLAPYMLLSFGGVALVYALARLVFRVPFLGNPFFFLLSTTLFLAATMSQGLVISVVTRQQQLAFQVAMNAGMMPIQLLSGFIFPVESMPAFFQKLTMIIPARWYMELTRSLFLRAPDFAMLARPLAALTLLTAFFMALAWRKFKTDLEP
ncbi:ABC transporter permease [bacterium]|nr:MAG: ABC transporter permease [bacterium]